MYQSNQSFNIPPWATEHYCLNSPLPKRKCRSNAPHKGPLRWSNAPTQGTKLSCKAAEITTTRSLNAQLFFVCHVLFQKRVRGFHEGFQTRENWWKHEAAGRVLLLFSSVWKPWWNPMHEFLKWLLQRNNTKLCSVVFFPFFFKMPCMCDLLYSVRIHCICELLFLIIVSRCIKFVFQKGCELEVIYILFLPWPKKGFASRKQSRKKNFT